MTLTLLPGDTAKSRTPVQLRMSTSASPWEIARDADPTATALYLRHYSARRKDLRRGAKFVGPGSYIVLLTPEGDALFVWRRFRDALDDGTGRAQEGISCACFRNEGSQLSSELVLAAEPFAWAKWPEESRLYTLVNAKKVRPKRDPGRCFRKAGWNTCGWSRGGLLILEKRQ